MATSADPTVQQQHPPPHPRTVSTTSFHSTVSSTLNQSMVTTPAAEALLSTTTASIQTSPVAASLSDSFDGLEIDRSFVSNNSTTQSPPPPNALQPPTFQELPPLPPALQQLTSDSESSEKTMGAEANTDYANASSTGSSKSENLRLSVAHLKQEMKNLRNADLTLLFQLNDLHQQILSYKVAISERQSETNSEYSNSFAEDYDFEDIEEDEDDVDEDEEEKETRYGSSLLTNGDAAGDYVANGISSTQHGPPPPQHGPPLPQHGLQPPQHGSRISLHQQQASNGNSLPTPGTRDQQCLQRNSSQSPPAQEIPTRSHRPLPNDPNNLADSSNVPPPPSSSRSSLQQLRQQLPPPPPRPAQDARQDGRVPGRDGGDVNQWLDLDYQPDSYNC